MDNAILMRPAVWPDDQNRLRAVRDAVFVLEQAVPANLEWDGKDADCWHVIAMASNTPVATGRLQPNGKIGRMAVLEPWRGRGLGSRILLGLVDIARENGLSDVFLHAQSHALDFYARHGFVVYGDEFVEADIAHRAMHKKID